MTDGVIKGTGNSRFLKVPPNALTLYPTWEAAVEAMIAGTFPIDLNGVNPAGWDVQGDKLNKATLLSDTLCTALGLATTATPTQAMEKLRQLVNSLDTTKARVVVGTYVGTKSSSNVGEQTISLPFTPKAVMVAQEGDFTDTISGTYYGISSGIALDSYPLVLKHQYGGLTGLSIGINCFIAYTNRYGGSSEHWSVNLNSVGYTYVYLAFG